MPDYTKYIDKSGTIYNTQTGQGYASEAELASDLGTTTIDWGQIRKDPAYAPGQKLQTHQEGFIGTGEQARIDAAKLAGATLPANLATGDIIDNANSIGLNLSTGSTTADIEKNVLGLQQQMLDELQAGREEKKSMFEGLIKQRQEIERPDSTELFNQALSQYGFTPEEFQKQRDLETKIAGFASQLAAIDTLTGQKALAAQQETAPLSYIQGKEALIRRQAALEKSGIAAQAGVLQMQYEMARGRLDDARDMADRVVDMATLEYQQNIQDFDAFSNLYGDFINSMSDADQQIIQTAYQFNQDALETKRADISQVLDIFMQYPDIGITTDMSVTDAIDKVMSNAESIQFQEQPALVGSSTQGYYQYDNSNGQWNKVIPATPTSGSGGGGGGVSAITQAVISNPSLYNSLTPTEKGRVISEMQTSGQDLSDFGGRELSSTMATSLAEFDTTIYAWENVERLYNELNSKVGPFNYRVYNAPMSQLFLQLDDASASALRAEVEKAFQLYRKETTGAQASDREIKMLRPNLPALSDTPKAFLEKLRYTVEGTKRAQGALVSAFDAANYNVSAFTDLEETVDEAEADANVTSYLESIGF